jgi:DinB superfamily
MIPELESKWNHLVASKDDFLKAIAEINLEKFHTNPADGWSASQVAEHILSAETGTLGYMKKKSSGGWDQLDDTADEHHSNSTAINNRLKSEERYKAPSVLPEPENKISLEEFSVAWNSLRAEMKEFLEQVEKQHEHKLVFRQPIAGMLNVHQAVEFMNNHLRHHLPQIDRIKREIA